MENKEQGLHGPTMTREEYQAMSVELNRNKEQMFHILQHSPKLGVYLGQSREEWEKFFIFFINFLKSEIGPRGDCAKAVRAALLTSQAEVNAALLPFNQTAHTHIRDILTKNKFFVPCPEYPQLLKMEESNDKSKTSLQRLQDPLSPMRKAIAEGLIAKHGPEYDLETEFTRLQANYTQKMIEADVEIARLRGIVMACPKYHEYMRVKELMEPYFAQWQEADSGMGKENLKTGQAFQEKVNAEVLPYLLAREKADPQWQYSSKQIQVFTNVSWIPRNLGEIDIAFGYRDEVQDRYFIFTLIQCKSRLFDLREAYKQVSLDDREALNKGPTFQELKEIKRLKLAARNPKKSKKQEEIKKEESNQQLNPKEQQKQPQEVQLQRQESTEKAPVMGKKFLSTKYGPAQLVDNHHFYMVTTLPQNQFILPIESKMKESIQKYSKNRFIEDMQSEPLYLILREVFKERMSPLDWLSNYEKSFGKEESNVLVLR